MEVALIGIVVALALGAALVRIFEKVLDINLTSWSLRRQGVKDEEVQKVALASARRQHRYIVLQILDRVLAFVKSRRS